MNGWLLAGISMLGFAAVARLLGERTLAVLLVAVGLILACVGVVS